MKKLKAEQSSEPAEQVRAASKHESAL